MRLLRYLSLLIVLIALAPAAASAACGNTIINDYLDDGVVDGKYSQTCYDQALGSLDDDLKEYTNAETDIGAAKLRQKQADAKAAAKPPAQPQQPERSVSEESPDDPSTDEVAPAAGAAGSNDPPADGPKEVAAAEAEPETPTTEAASIDTGEVLGTVAEVAPAEDDVRTQDGPLQQALRDVGPSHGNDVPIPVLVLAGLAILLMSVGAGGLVLRRMHSD